MTFCEKEDESWKSFAHRGSPPTEACVRERVREISYDDHEGQGAEKKDDDNTTNDNNYDYHRTTIATTTRLTTTNTRMPIPRAACHDGGS